MISRIFKQASVACLIATLALPCAAQQRRRPQGQALQINPDITQKLADALGRDWGEGGTPEWAKMASQILSGQDTMGIGKGWFQPAKTRHTWKWLRAEFDTKPKDGEITRKELPKGTTDLQFSRLDRDKNGVITSRDLLWVNNHLMEGNAPSNVLFRQLDTDSNGRLTREEMNKFFDKQADGFEFLTLDDLKNGVTFPPMPPSGANRRPAQIPVYGRWQLLDLLLNEGLGNLEAGPDLGDDAPDFELPVLEKDQVNHELKLSTDWIRLSDAKGKRPTVLIFGSFT